MSTHMRASISALDLGIFFHALYSIRVPDTNKIREYLGTAAIYSFKIRTLAALVILNIFQIRTSRISTASST